MFCVDPSSLVMSLVAETPTVTKRLKASNDNNQF